MKEALKIAEKYFKIPKKAFKIQRKVEAQIKGKGT